MVLAYGVIGNTTDFGSVILGSSPSRPTKCESQLRLGFFFGPGLHKALNVLYLHH